MANLDRPTAATAIGEVCVTQFGERREIIAVENANDYLARISQQQAKSYEGAGEAERCAFYGSPTFKDRQRRADEIRRLNGRVKGT